MKQSKPKEKEINDALREYYEFQQRYGDCGRPFLFAVVIAVMLLLSSCRTVTEVVEVERVRTDTLYKTKTEKEYVYRHDSIYIHEQDGNVTTDRTITIYKDRAVHDTVRETIRDSIPVPVPVPEYVERELTWWQRTRMVIGDLSLIAILVAGTVIIIKKRTRM